MTGLLIFIGLILVILNVLSIKKQKKSFNGILGNSMENIGDDDIRIGELRLEFSESILEIQSEMMVMKEMIEKNNRINKNHESLQDVNNRENNEKIYAEVKEEIVINEIIADKTQNTNSAKVEEIKRLFNEGLSLDEISELSHLGKGEVLLIKDLYIR